MRIYKLISILVISLSCLRGAYADLECPPPGSMRVALANATAVFAGEVVSEEYPDVNTDPSGKPAEARVLVIKLKVKRWWKGDGAEEVQLYTSSRKYPDGRISEIANDFFFREGESYLVYAYGPKEKLRTDGCGRTRNLADAGEDLRELGEGKVPEKKRSTSSGEAKAKKRLQRTRLKQALVAI